jgi:hypothetical protein
VTAATGQRPDRRDTLTTVVGALLATFAAFAPMALVPDPFLGLLALVVVWSCIAVVTWRPLAERIAARFELGWRYGRSAADVRRAAWVVVGLAGGGLLLRDALRGDFGGLRLAGCAVIAGSMAVVVWALRGRSR